MASAKRFRKSICRVIVSAVTNDENNDASGEIDFQLDKIFASYFEGKNDGLVGVSNNDENDDNVTPLMMACDKCCSEALSYLQNQIRASVNHKDDNDFPPQAIKLEHLVEAWGHPTESSSCGNTAAHHALAVSFSLGLDTLEEVWRCFEGKKSQNDGLRRYISLLSRTNQNGDTPLMMACVSGHSAMIEYILEHSLILGLGTQYKPKNVEECVEKIRQPLTDIFSMRNTEECTALNLACGHGHAEIVRFLVQPQQVQFFWSNNSLEVKIQRDVKEKSSHNKNIYNLKRLVNATYADIDFCKKTIENLADGLEFMKNRNQVDKIKEFDSQHKKASECLVVLQCELERSAAVTANELLMLDSDLETKRGGPIAKPNVGHKPKGKSKKKKRQKRNNTKRKQAQHVPGNVDNEREASDDAVHDDTTADNGSSHEVWTTLNDIDLPSSPFITLQDGTVISKSHKVEYPSSIEPDRSSLDDATFDRPITSGGIAKPKTLQSILESTTSSTTSSSPAADGDMAAVMESLCLDPSMLLLSPHGMAMEMSPCQLDAIESILNHQLNATQEARKIQSRLLDK